MGNWQNLTLGEVGRAFARYRPFVAVVAAVVLVVAFLPGEQKDEQQVTADKFGLSTGAGADGAAATDAAGAATDATGSATDATAGSGATVGTGGATGGAAAGGARPGATAGAATGVAAGAPGGQAVTGQQAAVPTPEKIGPDCDPATGRLRFPSRFAPACKPIVTNNGGATSFGVTGDKITMVWYRGKADPAVSAALTAAGANDNWEDVLPTIKVWNDFLNHHYNLYGRQIDMQIFEGAADAKDDAAAIADAKALADRFKPFVVINAINNAMVDELVARKILCICTTSQPQEFYEARFPYAGWTTLMSSTQGYIHRAEYIGKRLAGNGRKAKYAGFRDNVTDPMSDEERVFGLLWYNTPDGSYRSGAEFFERELARYGVKLKVSLAYPSELQAAQEQTRSLISRLKAEGVTSVIFSGDPITPATFTTEAQNQQWQPEWIITGSALTDTSLFARTYNQDQWSRAFGIAYLNLRLRDSTKAESYNLHVWHTGKPPQASHTFPVLWAPFFVVGTGIDMAGPKLTPQSFAQGLFDFPVSGAGGVTGPTVSYGRHGIWDKPPHNLVDLTQFDDVAEIYWDRTAQGPDDVGNNGVGMYRWVNNGKRYLPGAHPTTDPRVYGDADVANSPTILEEAPASEKVPEYEHKHYYGN
jgi:hypothetical protein